MDRSITPLQNGRGKTLMSERRFSNWARYFTALRLVMNIHDLVFKSMCSTSLINLILCITCFIRGNFKETAMLKMAKVNTSWTSYFREKENDFHGWVTSSAEADALIREYEVIMQSHYVVVRETRRFGSFDLSCSHKVKHVDDGKIKKGSRIINHGIPFMITGQKLLECHQGSTHWHTKNAEEINDDHNYKQNAYKKKVTGSKKMGCESCIVLREVVFFPDFKPTSATEHHQKLKSKQLRTALQSSSAESIQCQKRIFVDLPDEDSHSDHLTGDAADIKAPIDGRVVDNLKSLVEDGVKTTGELVRHSRIFVRKLFPQTPSTTNRRFFPSNVDVRKVATAHMKKISHGLVDQERLKATIPTIKEEGDYTFFRARGSESDESQEGRLLFIHQSHWQKRLLSMYGQEMVLLDATYKTSQYALPLFFISVKTNSGYAVVASFVVEREDTASLTEALTKLHQENPSWNPSAFMIDNSDVEMNAISSTFQDAKIYLCDFHRKQSWLRWIRNHKNQVFNDEAEIMTILNICKVIDTDLNILFEFPQDTPQENCPEEYKRHLDFCKGKKIEHDESLFYFDQVGFALLLDEIDDKLTETTIGDSIFSIPTSSMNFPSYIKDTSKYCQKVLEYFIMHKVMIMLMK